MSCRARVGSRGKIVPKSVFFMESFKLRNNSIHVYYF